MTAPVGHKTWAIPDGYIPGWSHGPEPELASHESLAVLNAGERDAQLQVTAFFSDRDPAGPYEIQVPAKRTKHVRLNELEEPEPIPAETEYALLVRSDVPVVVQQTRLDSRQAENALLGTLGYASGD